MRRPAGSPPRALDAAGRPCDDHRRAEVTMDLFEGCRGTSLSDRLQWLREPESWGFQPEGLAIVPAGRTDFFCPVVGEPVDNACLLYTRVRGDFTAVTDARAVLAGFGDAAALTIRARAGLWAKICIERSPHGQVSIVTVVTSGRSDDANNEILETPAAALRVTRSGAAFAFHYRVGDGKWRFVRTFGLEMPEEIMVGIHAQAPFGAGCRASFARFELEQRAVANFRSGE
jgi:uncharacterized protein